MSRYVAFGEIMGRLATPGFKRFQQTMPGTLNVTFAGAEASIASSISYLGGDAAFVTALPTHEIADACVASLRSVGVNTRHIVRTPQGRLGLYFLETGANQRPGNVLYDREHSAIAITPAAAYDWDAIFADAEWFIVSGITPAISRNAAEVTLIGLREAARRKLKVAIDMNYRSKLWQWDPPASSRELATRTLHEMLPWADLFVGGREDAEALLGTHDAHDAHDAHALDQLARQVGQRFPNLSHIAMTVREGISATHNNFGGLIYDKVTDHVYHAPGSARLYPIPNIVDRIGAGDAFTAGLIFALTTPDLALPQSAIAFATAAGCLAHSIEGDCNFSTRAEIAALVNGASSGRVKR